ncbi:hypothetical protein MTBLM5_450017 [Magnetospirillum sp. LM-5]|nr:hypothetical protein MTBLM5_450017 [Magnetospirillum sp. LM-5]
MATARGAQGRMTRETSRARPHFGGKHDRGNRIAHGEPGDIDTAGPAGAPRPVVSDPGRAAADLRADAAHSGGHGGETVDRGGTVELSHHLLNRFA